MFLRYLRRIAREEAQKALEDRGTDKRKVVKRLDRLESEWKLMANEWADTYDKLSALRSRLAARDRQQKNTENQEDAPDVNAQILARRQRRRQLGG